MNVRIGIIGIGRIGTAVLKHLQGFGSQKILINDIHLNQSLEIAREVEKELLLC